MEKMKITELIIKLGELESAFKVNKKSLEEYWRSMYPIAIKHKDDAPTLELFYKLIAESLDNKPIEVNPEWLNVASPPSSNLFEQEVKNGSGIIKSESDDFTFFLNVLEFQIGELIKMKGKQLDCEYKYFGVKSESGYTWFNFDPLGILECGLSGMEANGFDLDLKSWIFLGEIIEMGRIYE